MARDTRQPTLLDRDKRHAIPSIHRTYANDSEIKAAAAAKQNQRWRKSRDTTQPTLLDRDKRHAIPSIHRTYVAGREMGARVVVSCAHHEPEVMVRHRTTSRRRGAPPAGPPEVPRRAAGGRFL